MMSCMPVRTCTQTEFLTKQESVNMLKNIIKIGISLVTYLRNLFEENAFEEVCVQELRLKKLLPYDDESRMIINWLEKGVFDAIEKEYLRILILDINDRHDNTIECYKFHFSYNSVKGGEVGISLETSKNNHNNLYTECLYEENKKKSYNISRLQSIKDRLLNRNKNKDKEKDTTASCLKQDAKEKTYELLKSLVIHTQSLNPLPDKTYLSMKLLYYDEVVPIDYQPPYFRNPDSQDLLKFVKIPKELPVGDVDTGHHFLSIMVNSTCNDPSEQLYIYELADLLKADINNTGQHTKKDGNDAVSEQSRDIIAGCNTNNDEITHIANNTFDITKHQVEIVESITKQQLKPKINQVGENKQYYAITDESGDSEHNVFDDKPISSEQKKHKLNQKHITTYKKRKIYKKRVIHIAPLTKTNEKYCKHSKTKEHESYNNKQCSPNHKDDDNNNKTHNTIEKNVVEKERSETQSFDNSNDKTQDLNIVNVEDNTEHLMQQEIKAYVIENKLAVKSKLRRKFNHIPRHIIDNTIQDLLEENVIKRMPNQTLRFVSGDTPIKKINNNEFKLVGNTINVATSEVTDSDIKRAGVTEIENDSRDNNHNDAGDAVAKEKKKKKKKRDVIDQKCDVVKHNHGKAKHNHVKAKHNHVKAKHNHVKAKHTIVKVKHKHGKAKHKRDKAKHKRDKVGHKHDKAGNKRDKTENKRNKIENTQKQEENTQDENMTEINNDIQKLYNEVYDLCKKTKFVNKGTITKGLGICPLLAKPLLDRLLEEEVLNKKLIKNKGHESNIFVPIETNFNLTLTSINGSKMK